MDENNSGRQTFQPRGPSAGWRVFGWLILIFVIVCLVGVIILYSGIYNVAASRGHSSFVEWILSTAMDRSLEYHSRDIKAPALTEAMAALGAQHYGRMCVGCHGGPGHEQSEIAEGLYPPPPDLVDSAKELKSAEIFWVIKNGIADSGMPSFGASRDDEKIWNITAFVMELPKLSPPQFEKMIGKKD